MPGSKCRHLEDPAIELEVSPASYWEIASNIRFGRYTLPESYDSFMDRQLAANDFRILHIMPRHTSLLTTMPLHHKDPFDRLLIAQALTERIPIVSADTAFDSNGVTRLW